MAEISIIVPIYNVEKYLCNCIESILNQSFSDFELILVDDGSPDNSGKICDEYALKDSRIKVIHKKNGGLSDARNVGAKNATTDYVVFVDADDTVKKNFCNDLITPCKKYKCDIVTSLVEEFVHDESTGNKYPKSEQIVSGKDAFSMVLVSNKIEYYGVAKLIKKDLFLKHQFPVGKTYEDAFTIPKLLFDAQEVCVTTNQNYNYIRRENTITIGKFKKSDLDCIEAHKQNLKFTEMNSKKDIEGAQFRVYWSLLYVLSKIDYFSCKQDFKLIKKEIMDNYIQLKRNSYLSSYRKLEAKFLRINVILYIMFNKIVTIIKNK